MVLTFEGTTAVQIGNFYIDQNGLLVGVVIRKEPDFFSVQLSGEAMVKLPFVCESTNTQSIYLDTETSLITLSSNQNGLENKHIGFLYGCEIDEEGNIILCQVGDLQKAFLRI